MEDDTGGNTDGIEVEDGDKTSSEKFQRRPFIFLVLLFLVKYFVITKYLWSKHR